ncbi:GNAT family N-acetyltransferase [Wenjunlia tyrosinilytica]|uniref:N-acetyltransferase n=1 Tax=Wenjunlia tyrosinilytica TaxID=1544741 RepID=A0A917ZU56_9ACTN|nr:GNAT family N-acetyltransferase [Wenjunlia tyrosinilytica]GGO95372.1 N-acetyltransferase [Wenjunlia tyrosinilytica]
MGFEVVTPAGIEVYRTSIADPAARPLVEELHREYNERYGPNEEVYRYPPEEFAPPAGAFLLLLENGGPVAGGAFRRYDEETAEVKRMWTSSAHRRRGLARRALRALEDEARAYGYRRMYLTTGPRQPEARGLYLAEGYSPLFDLTADPETIGPLPFEKALVGRDGRNGTP